MLHGCQKTVDQDTIRDEKHTSIEKVCLRQSPSASITVDHPSPPSARQIAVPAEIVAYTETNPSCTRLAHFLQSYSEPFAVRSQQMWNYNSLLGSSCFWLGPIIFKKWTKSGVELYDLQSEGSAFGLKLTVRSPKFYLRTLILQVFVQGGILRFEKWSLNLSISFPKIIPTNSLVMKMAEVGDVKGVMEMFGAGKAGCRDTTPDGISLLHVR